MKNRKTNMKKCHWSKIVYVKQGPLSTFCIGEGQFKFIREIFNYKIHFDDYRYVDGAVYYNTDEFERAQKIVSDAPLKIIPYLYKQLRKTCKEYLDAGQQYSKINFKQKSNQELKEHFQNFIRVYERGLSCLWVPIVVDPVITRYLQQELGKHISPEKSQKQYQRIFRILTSRTQEAETLKARKRLLKIAIEIKKNPCSRKIFNSSLPKITSRMLLKVNPAIESMIIQYLDDYSWAGTSFLMGNYRSRGAIIEELKLSLKGDPTTTLEQIKKSRKIEEKNFVAL